MKNAILYSLLSTKEDPNVALRLEKKIATRHKNHSKGYKRCVKLVGNGHVLDATK
jgi:hypothetical protein